MFEFLFKKNSEPDNYVSLLTQSLQKFQIKRFAVERAENIIANAIAKSEIKLFKNHKEVKNEIYFKLNIAPNDFMTGTEFWRIAVKKLLACGEVLIVPIGENFYIADSWTENETVLKPKRYTNIKISDYICNQIQINKTFKSNELLHLRYSNHKVRLYIEEILKEYEDEISIISNNLKIQTAPKFTINPPNVPIMKRKKADGTEVTLTIDEYIKELAESLKSGDISILKIPDSMKISPVDFKTGNLSTELLNIIHEVFTECTNAYDIPQSVFFGNITEKSDASNELITYAVSPIVEIINDGLNASFVGMDDFLNGEKIKVDITKFKHIDVIDSANNLDKLRSNGWTLDEIRELVGYEPIGDKFSTTRVLTKNYSEEGGESNGK